jgi:hypothetical protein
LGENILKLNEKSIPLQEWIAEFTYRKVPIFSHCHDLSVGIFYLLHEQNTASLFKHLRSLITYSSITSCLYKTLTFSILTFWKTRNTFSEIKPNANPLIASVCELGHQRPLKLKQEVKKINMDSKF